MQTARTSEKQRKWIVWDVFVDSQFQGFVGEFSEAETDAAVDATGCGLLSVSLNTAMHSGSMAAAG